VQASWLAKGDAVSTGERFTGKRALITGATRGLGLEVAHRLHAEGAHVILTGRNDASGRAALAELPGAEYWHLDVANEADWIEIAARLRSRGETLDVLVNNAAVVRIESLVDSTSAGFREVMETNLMGVYHSLSNLIPLMERGSSIVNVSSCAGLEGINGAASYVASKWALTGLTQAAALELGHREIRVNSVHPRSIATEMIVAKMAETGAAELFGRQAIPRVGLAREVAAMVAFLASSESGYCTGGAYLVDGGYMAGQIVPTMPLS
jgi:3alpha(or 20beta)-hydroxysteroid dehydrogenase